MNDLIQLTADLKQRYAATVRSRQSLQQLDVAIGRLQSALDTHALKLIRPENSYWAALSNVIASAVEETRVILRDARLYAQLNPVIRLCSYFCVGMGLDADVRTMTFVFGQIKKAVIISGDLSDLLEKTMLLRKVNSMGFTVTQQRLYPTLGKIQEESCSLSIDDAATEQTPLIKSGKW